MGASPGINLILGDPLSISSLLEIILLPTDHVWGNMWARQATKAAMQHVDAMVCGVSMAKKGQRDITNPNKDALAREVWGHLL